jgi:hypothetical protein
MLSTDADLGFGRALVGVTWSPRMSHAEGHRADGSPRPIRPKQGPLAATDLSGTAIEGEPHRHTLLTRYRSPRTTKTRAEGGRADQVKIAESKMAVGLADNRGTVPTTVPTPSV